jgi:hypothetical protein
LKLCLHQIEDIPIGLHFAMILQKPFAKHLNNSNLTLHFLDEFSNYPSMRGLTEQLLLIDIDEMLEERLPDEGIILPEMLYHPN